MSRWVRVGTFAFFLAIVGFAVNAVADLVVDARAEAKAARDIAKASVAQSILAEESARRAAQRARDAEVSRDSALKSAEQAAKDREAALDILDALESELPQECEPAFDAAALALSHASTVESSLRLALSREQTAHAETKAGRDSLQAALVTLRSATTGLVQASAKQERRGRWAKLLPRLGVGGAGGIDLFARPNAVTGITFGWAF